MHIDIAVFRLINNLANMDFWIDRFMIFLSSYLIICIPIIIITLIVGNKYRQTAISIIISTLIAVVVGKISGLFYSHYQPFVELNNVNLLIKHDINNSFPSDHTIVYTCFLVGLMFMINSKKKWWIIPPLILLLGISRIWVGVHFPMDVLYSLIISIIISNVTWYYVKNGGKS